MPALRLAVRLPAPPSSVVPTVDVQLHALEILAGDEVDDAADGVGAVQGRGAVEQHFDALRGRRPGYCSGPRPLSSPGEAKLAMRRPLSSTSVDEVPMPRRLALLKPRWSPPTLMLAPSVRPPLVGRHARHQFGGRGHARLLDFVARDHSAPAAPSPTPRRLMAEPVISTRGKSVAVTAGSVCAARGRLARAMVVPAQARRTPRTARAPGFKFVFINSP